MYFDYTATTPMDPEIIDTYVKVQKEYFANTTSLHKLGQINNQIYEKMIANIQETMGVKHNIVFTSNATEANNLAILGVVEGKKGRVITSSIEHASVFNVFKHLEDLGYEVIYLKTLSNGLIDLVDLKNNLTKDTVLVSIMWVNNIVGTIQPVQEIIDIMKDYPKAKFHCDIVQGICKVKPKFKFNDIDLLTFSAHKFYGPKGIGALLYKPTIDLSKQLFGSGAQYGIKPGTFDLGLIVCLAKALKKNYNLIDEHLEYVRKLNDYIYKNINNSLVKINSYQDVSSPYIINISIGETYGETLVHYFEEKDIYVSTGSSCSSKLRKPEKTIYAMTNDEKRAIASIRISLSHLTTLDEVKALVKAINEYK